MDDEQRGTDDAKKEDILWWKGTAGELIAIRVDSGATGGAYAVLEALHQPDCFVPLHLHRNEEEHFLVLEGRYRIAIGDRVIEAEPGDRATVPKNTPHCWRNISSGQGRLLVVLTPGGFERLVSQDHDLPEEALIRQAAEYGCDILGPPTV